MKYMLDTNIVIYVIKHKPESVLQKFQSLEPSDFCISSITLAEIEYGISKSSRPDRNRFAFDMFISGIDILSFDDAAASEYGPIRAGLNGKARQSGPMIC